MSENETDKKNLYINRYEERLRQYCMNVVSRISKELGVAVEITAVKPTDEAHAEYQHKAKSKIKKLIEFFESQDILVEDFEVNEMCEDYGIDPGSLWD